MMIHYSKNRLSGFTLAEMAIVLVIVGLLLGGMLMPIATQVQQQKATDTRKTLEQIKEALLGFAAANGRLPCPASATSAGQESFAGGGNASNGLCSNFYNGFLPAATLGIMPSDGQGYAIDAWGLTQNRIHYAVYTGTINAVTNPFTRTNGLRSAGINNVAATLPLLSVCASASGISATNCGGGLGNTLANNVPIIIYSLGKNAANGGATLDEAANPNPGSANNDAVFVAHDPTPANAPNGEFDDIVTWLSLNTLFSRMIMAGSLP